ncbi:hypothetical protein [Pseudidiomarina insulisalsae]|uniref:DUF1566 domain-containing protein n=1 Tax=Pseudidiomarina insulisalsae TaxID=575789 RepID=A0A432YQB6_9GAMM|nr:hypothetical protein [Pseudidiomarina insulisalsae]RUO63512.1 hypothetical protein CWI71_00130 [Pseudidiomarina insulisalsae]
MLTMLVLLLLHFDELHTDLVACQPAVPLQQQFCLQQDLLSWNEARQVLRQLNASVARGPTWRLPTVKQLRSVPLPCDFSTPDKPDNWWLSAGIIRHGNEILIAAYNCATGNTEFVPVSESLRVMLRR